MDGNGTPPMSVALCDEWGPTRPPAGAGSDGPHPVITDVQEVQGEHLAGAEPPVGH